MTPKPATIPFVRQVITSIALLFGTFVLVTPSGDTAHAAIDLTGNWTFQFEGDFPVIGHVDETCDMDIAHTGDEIAGGFDCDGTEGDYTGMVEQQDVGATIDATLTVDPTGFPEFIVDATGDVSPDGNTFAGTWYSPTYDNNGTFEGFRDVLQYVKGDLTCDTNVDGLDALAAVTGVADVEPAQQPGCPPLGAALPASQQGALFGDMDCDSEVAPSDLIALLHHIAGFDTGLPEECLPIGDTFTVPRA